MTVDLINEYPILSKLSSKELDEAISQGGLLLALMRARIRQVTQPRKPGRPATTKTTRKVIQRRGRKAELQIHNSCTNIQLAELARAWRDSLGGTGANAVRQTFNALGISPTTGNVRTIAKLLSDLPGLEHDKNIRRMDAERKLSGCTPGADFSLMGQLSRIKTKGG